MISTKLLVQADRRARADFFGRAVATKSCQLNPKWLSYFPRRSESSELVLVLREDAKRTRPPARHCLRNCPPAAPNDADCPSQTVRRYLASPDAAAGPHLAERLLPPMVLVGGEVFTTRRPRLHAEKSLKIITTSVDLGSAVKSVSSKVWRIAIGGGAIRTMTSLV